MTGEKKKNTIIILEKNAERWKNLSKFIADKDYNMIWNECSNRIRKLCKIKLGDSPEAAEDVCSDIYLAFAEAVKSGREITYPKAWLYKVANNLIIKKYEELRIQKERMVTFDENNTELMSLVIIPDMTDCIITDKDIQRFADEIMFSLSEEEEKLLRFFYDENMSLREIAGIFGKTESAVKQQHYRLCKRIKKAVNERIENF